MLVVGAFDGFSIFAVCKTSFVRISLNYLLVPFNYLKIKLILWNGYYESEETESNKKNSYIQKRKIMLIIKFDTWQMDKFKNRRYLNINIHYLNRSCNYLSLIKSYEKFALTKSTLTKAF